ncbi:four helix bundle protein, partial [bacterium]
MAEIKSHKDLVAYQKAYQLCIDVYLATQEFPKWEQFGLKTQMRRAAV